MKERGDDDTEWTWKSSKLYSSFFCTQQFGNLLYHLTISARLFASGLVAWVLSISPQQPNGSGAQEARPAHIPAASISPTNCSS